MKTILIITVFFASMFLTACSNGVQAEMPVQLNNLTMSEVKVEASEQPGHSTGSQSDNNIPNMLIKYLIDDVLHEMTAWQGVADWFFENEDGTTGSILTDSPHPLQAVRNLPVIDRSLGVVTLLDLFFEIPPDSITSRRWVVDDIDTTKHNEMDYSHYETVFMTDTTIFILDNDNSYIYEVTAQWLLQGFERFATYAFYVTNSIPIDVPRRTPQLYVSLSTEGLLKQHFQALQLSNDWFPNSSDENQPLSGG